MRPRWGWDTWPGSPGPAALGGRPPRRGGPTRWPSAAPTARLRRARPADADGLVSPSHGPSGGWRRARPSRSTTRCVRTWCWARGSSDEPVDDRRLGWVRRRPRRPGRRAPGPDRPPQRAVPHARQPRDHRRRVRRGSSVTLRDLEAEHPDLAVPDSPTSQVGAAPSALFAPVVHHVPMMSLDNTFSPEELRAWADRRGRSRCRPDTAFECELKIDGLAILPPLPGRPASCRRPPGGTAPRVRT